MFYLMKDVDGKIIDACDKVIYIGQIGNIKRVIHDPNGAIGILGNDKKSIYYCEEFIKRDNVMKLPIVTLHTVDENEYRAVIQELQTETVAPSILFAQDNSLEALKARKLQKLSVKCEEMIIAGIEINGKRYRLTIEDQINLLHYQTVIATSDEDRFMFHASGDTNTYHTREVIQLIIDNATLHKSYHMAYYNALKNYVNSINNITELNLVEYGTEVPEEFQTETYRDLKARKMA